VQLDRGVALLGEGLRKVRVGFWTIQPARQIVPAHRAPVRPDRGPITAQEPADGQAGRAAGEIPERLVDHGDVAVGKRLRLKALVPAEGLPDPFAVPRVLAGENGPRGLDHRLGPAETIAFRSFVGGDRGQGLQRVVRRPRVAVAFGVMNDARGVPEGGQRDLRDAHGRRSDQARAECGSAASRRPSPKKLKASTTAEMNAAGRRSHG